MNINKPNDKNVILVKSILKELEKYDNYCDENNNPHIIINNTNYLLDDKNFKDEIFDICIKNDIDAGMTIVNKVISILKSRIRGNGLKKSLDYRVSKSENDILYQLSNKEMVVISKKGYKVEKVDNTYFKMNNTFKEQNIPVLKKGDIDNLINLLNLSDDDKFLVIIHLHLLFIPKISIPALVLTSEKATGKTTITKIIKRLVDPTPNGIGRMPKGMPELEKMFASSHLLCFDNIDYLSNEQSNAICRAITGDTYEKTNFENSYISQYARPIIINGINCPIFKSDLISRCIIIEPNKIKDVNRLTDNEITEIIEQNIDLNLGYIFENISKILNIVDNLVIPNSNYRMGDYNKYAYAIANIIEPKGGDRFLKIMNYKQERQNKTIVNNNSVATNIIDYFTNYGVILRRNEPQEYTSTEFYNIIRNVAYDNGNINNFPKASNKFITELNKIKDVLRDEEILITTNISKCNANYVRVERVLKGE